MALCRRYKSNLRNRRTPHKCFPLDSSPLHTIRSLQALTMAAPSTFDFQNNEIPRLQLRELVDILSDEEFHPFIDDVFPQGRNSTINLRNFGFISHSIRKMKQELQRYKEEQERIFIELEDDILFREDFHLIHQYYRTRKARMTHSHPHQQSMSKRPSHRTSRSPNQTEVIL